MLDWISHVYFDCHRLALRPNSTGTSLDQCFPAWSPTPGTKEHPPSLWQPMKHLHKASVESYEMSRLNLSTPEIKTKWTINASTLTLRLLRPAIYVSGHSRAISILARGKNQKPQNVTAESSEYTAEGSSNGDNDSSDEEGMRVTS